MGIDPKLAAELAARKGMSVDQITSERPEWMDRLHVEPRPCSACAHCDTRRESVVNFLRTRGISQAGDTPGENTVAREFGWNEIMPKLDLIALCRVPERSGSILVELGSTCPLWAEDRGRIWMPVSRGRK